MPGLDRRGPNGEGAMTGRKMGRCNPDNRGKTDAEILQSRETGMQDGAGLGLGLGRRRGRGLRLGLGLGRGRANRFGYGA